MSRVQVKWSGFQSSVSRWLTTLRNSDLLTDVTIYAEGRSLTAHRLVLSASSKLFRDIFRDNPCDRPIVVLHDVSYDALVALVSYLYDGEIDVHEDLLPALVRTAERLQVDGLSFDADLPLETVIKEEVPSSGEYDECPAPAPAPSKRTKRRSSNRSKKRPRRETDDSVDSLLRPSKYTNKENENSVANAEPVADSTRDDGLEAVMDFCHDAENIFGGGGNVTGDTVISQCEETNEAFCINADSNRDECIRPTFPCPFCGRVYYSWGYRRRHVKTHHESNSLTCKLCSMVLDSEVTWFDHVVNSHGVPHSQARDALVIMVEAHSVLTSSSPPSPVSMLHHLQLDHLVNYSDHPLKEQTAI